MENKIILKQFAEDISDKENVVNAAFINKYDYFTLPFTIEKVVDYIIENNLSNSIVERLTFVSHNFDFNVTYLVNENKYVVTRIGDRDFDFYKEYYSLKEAIYSYVKLVSEPFFEFKK